MNSIDIYGYADQKICAGCEGSCADGDCAPGTHRSTRDLVAEFRRLLDQAGIAATVDFYEATPENLERHADVQQVLSMAELTPAVVLNGKLLFFGGFSPDGLVEEVRRRV